jgi:hypothetical protein
VSDEQDGFRADESGRRLEICLARIADWGVHRVLTAKGMFCGARPSRCHLKGREAHVRRGRESAMRAIAKIKLLARTLNMILLVFVLHEHLLLRGVFRAADSLSALI